MIVLFGGDAGGGETWEWNGGTWSQRAVSGPSPRSNHAMAYDSTRGVTVLYGGSTGSSETWEWNGTAWTQRMASGPSSRSQHAMAYDAVRGVTVLFGGASSSGEQTWEWNGTAWSRHVVPGPAARFGHAMAYDAARGVTVLFGGRVGGSTNDETWEWNGIAWSRRFFSGPPCQAGHRMAYDSARTVTTLFGGYLDAGINGETWQLGVAGGPFIITQPTAQAVCSGGSVSFAVGAIGTGPFTYQWQKGTDVLVDEPNQISGATAATLVIVNTTESDEGSYHCTVSSALGSVESDAATLSVCDYLADLSCDGRVDISDLAVLLSNFGRTDSPPRTDGNLDGDEMIGLADLGILLVGFGAACP